MKKIVVSALLTVAVIGGLVAADAIQSPSGEIHFPTATSPEEQGLFYAVINNDDERVKELVTSKVNPNALDSQGKTPLHYAQNLRMIKLLVENGADVNTQDNLGITRLHIDVTLGHLKSVQYLLSKKAQPNIATTTGVTPLHLSTAISFYENPGLRRFGKVAEFGAGIGASTIVGTAAGSAAGAATSAVATPVVGTAVGIVVGLGAGIVASKLGEKGAHITIEALITSINIGERALIVRLLLDNGANPNAQDEVGNTPLHTLAEGAMLKEKMKKGGVVMAKYLILKGAKRDIKNNKGQTPYDMAKANKRFLLMPVLNPYIKFRPVERALQWQPKKKLKAQLH